MQLPPLSSTKKAKDLHRHPNMQLPQLPGIDRAALKASWHTLHPAAHPCIITCAGTCK